MAVSRRSGTPLLRGFLCPGNGNLAGNARFVIANISRDLTSISDPHQSFERNFGTAGTGRKVGIGTIRAMVAAKQRNVPVSENASGQMIHATGRF